MKNLNEEVNKIKHLFNFKKGDTKKVLTEQAQLGDTAVGQSIIKKAILDATGTTTITGLQLKQATIKREGMYVKVSFSRNDMEDWGSSYAITDMNGTCDILLFMKNGKIDYSNAYCVSEEGRDYPEMQKFVEFRLDLPASADTNNFSQDILTAFKK